MTAQVLAFPSPKPDPFMDAWEARKGMMRKRGDGKEKTRKLWNKAAKIVGHDRLLAALKRYCAEKEPTCGFCGLSVWLNGEKYDHWMESEPSVSDLMKAEGRPCFPEPFRSRVVSACGEPWVISYLDRCELGESPNGPVLIVASQTAASRLREKARELKAVGLYGVRMKA